MDSYPDALLRRGLKCREARENTDPILEEAMMYSVTVGVELLHGMADIIDTVDGMVLEMSANKADADGKVVQLWHRLGNVETRMSVVEEWKGDVTVHLQELGEQRGEDRRQMREAEERINQLQVLAVASDVIWAQNEVFQVQNALLLELERKQGRERRRLDPKGRTLGNLIIIEDDEVTLVEAPRVVRELIPINDTDDGLD